MIIMLAYFGDRMKKEQSALLTAFYRAFLFFADTGENPYKFSRANGLCGSLAKFLAATTEDYSPCEEMYQQFKDAHLDVVYPFNNGSGFNYDHEMKTRNTTKNQTRLKWVRDHAQ